MRIYCGTKPLPAAYDVAGTPYQCLKKGFGAGLHSTRKQGAVYMYILGLVVAVVVTSGLVFGLWYIMAAKKNINEEQPL